MSDKKREDRLRAVRDYCQFIVDRPRSSWLNISDHEEARVDLAEYILEMIHDKHNSLPSPGPLPEQTEMSAVEKAKLITTVSNWLLEQAPETYQIQSSYGRNIDAADLVQLVLDSTKARSLTPSVESPKDASTIVGLIETRMAELERQLERYGNDGLNDPTGYESRIEELDSLLETVRATACLTLTPSPESPRTVSDDDGLEKIKTALRYCRNELQYRLWQIEEGHLSGFNILTGEMNTALRMADEALALKFLPEGESRETAETQETPEITRERNRIFVRKVEELKKALELKDERIADLEAEVERLKGALEGKKDK